MINCITINTDASWHPKFKIVGYAFSVVCDNFRIRHAGVSNTNAQSSTQAELMAIANALHATAKHPHFVPSKLVVVNTDSTHAIERIGHGSNCKIGRFVAKKASELRKLGVLKIEYRHVKAHTGIQDKRSIVNEWCDMNAKHFMRTELQKLKSTNKI